MSSQSTSSRSHVRLLVAGVLAAVLVAGVFSLYTRPDFILSMAGQVWACF